MTTNDRTDELRIYLDRVRPLFHRLFNLAHAICGNADRAEYSVRSAMLDCWVSGEAAAGSHGLRESLRRSTISAALEAAAEKPEEDWDELCDGEGSALYNLITQEGQQIRRALVLRYGCGFSAGKIAKLLGIKAKRARLMLDHFENRAARKLGLRNIEASLMRTVRTRLDKPAAAEPEISGVFRTFRSDAAEMPVSRHLTAKIIRIVVTVLLALICIVGFFLAAVLMQPEGTIRTDADHSAIEQIDET